MGDSVQSGFVYSSGVFKDRVSGFESTLGERWRYRDRSADRARSFALVGESGRGICGA